MPRFQNMRKINVILFIYSLLLYPVVVDVVTHRIDRPVRKIHHDDLTIDETLDIFRVWSSTTAKVNVTHMLGRNSIESIGGNPNSSLLAESVLGTTDRDGEPYTIRIFAVFAFIDQL